MCMKKISFFLLMSFLFILRPGTTYGQGHEVAIGQGKSRVLLGAGLVSRYIWRGMQLGGAAPNIQPFFTFKNGNFEAGVWGAFPLSGDNVSQEIDLHVSQSFAKDMFTVTITDYFFPEEYGDYNYFRYGKNVTGHIFEGTLIFNGTKEFPMTALLATNFYGNDASRIDDNPDSPEFNQKTGIQYSTYFELGLPFRIKTVDLNTFIGINITTPKKANTTTGYIGETGFYGTGLGIVNLGFTASETVKITQIMRCHSWYLWLPTLNQEKYILYLEFHFNLIFI